MEFLEHHISLFLKAAFVENLALAFFLGMCTFLAVSKDVKTALGLGLAVIVIQAITVPINNILFQFFLKEGGLGWASSSLAGVDLTFVGLISYIGTIALPDAGTWTVVAYAHVGPDPFTSDHVIVTVQ